METFDIKKGKNLGKLIFQDNVNKTFENQQIALNAFLHAADISAPSKDFKIAEKWKTRVYEEFFNQGDKEKEMGVNVSLLCDRQTTNVNKSQVGFINFIVLPLFEAVADFEPKSVVFCDNLKANLKKYQSFVNEEEAKEKKSG